MTQTPLDLSNESLTMDCLLRHGLEQQPFDVIAGDTFLYTDPALDMVVGVLLEHLRNDDSMLLLKGDTGAGKSTQLLRLLSKGAESLEFCAFKARAGTTFAAVDHTIRQFWKRAAQGEDNLPLDQLICNVATEGRRPAVVIDDAHHLDPAVLRELAQLRRSVQRRCDSLPGLLLVGEPVIESRLEQTSTTDAPDEPRISVQLRPLTREQTEAYLRHRLQAAGADDPDMLGGDIALAIHQESGGLPQKINILANRHLQAMAPDTDGTGAVTGNAEPRSTTVLWKSRGFQITVAIILGVGVLTTLMNILSSPDEPLETRELLVLPEPRPLSTPSSGEPPAAETEPGIRFEPPPAAVLPEPLPGPAPREPISEATPEPEPAPEQPPTEPEQAEAVPAPAPEEPPPSRTESPPEPPPAAAPSPAATLHDATWIRQQPDSRYTIQILGGSDLQALRRYGRDQGLDMDLAWFRTRRNGADWYVLVAGQYPDAETARAAISRLPDSVRRNQPWIRSFGSVKQAMEAAR